MKVATIQNILGVIFLLIIFSLFFALFHTGFPSTELGLDGHIKVNPKFFRDFLDKSLKIRSQNEKKKPDFYVRQHGKYWILYYYIAPKRPAFGNNSITLTTHAEYSDLDLLWPLLDRWRAPVSLTLITNGNDFIRTINTLRFYNDCSEVGEFIRRLVTFNFCIHEDHFPKYIPQTEDEIFSGRYNCHEGPPYAQGSRETYRKQHNLEYPVNLLRNIARASALTYYTFPLDMGVFPTPNFVNEFFEMLEAAELENPLRSVFCMPIFRIGAGQIMPWDKFELIEFLRQNISKPLHREFVSSSYEMPNQTVWLDEQKPKRIRVFDVLKRSGIWDPYYVTINKEEPMYDERYNLDSVYNKVTQAELLMHLDYDFVILDGTFLIQRYGLDIYSDFNKVELKAETIAEQRSRMQNFKQLLLLYGSGTKHKKEGSIKMKVMNAFNY